jgi:hypothetical protein
LLFLVPVFIAIRILFVIRASVIGCLEAFIIVLVLGGFDVRGVILVIASHYIKIFGSIIDIRHKVGSVSRFGLLGFPVA